MNDVLSNVLRQLHLKPGTYRCELPEHEVVVQVRLRKSCESVSRPQPQSEEMTLEPPILDESCIMLDPWVELPGLTGGIILQSHLGEPDLPDVPDIPPYDEGEEGAI